MTDTITLTGVVATPPRVIHTTSSLAITSFRLASSQRRYDRQKSVWVDAETNWYTVTAFRSLATNVAVSLAKGDRVVVTGRLRVRAWQTDDKSGTTIEVDAEAIGHDLYWGTSVLTKVPLVARSNNPAGSASPSLPTVADDAVGFVGGSDPAVGGALVGSVAAAGAPGGDVDDGSEAGADADGGVLVGAGGGPAASGAQQQWTSDDATAPF